MSPQDFADLAAWLREQFRIAAPVLHENSPQRVRVRYCLLPSSTLPTIDTLDPGFVCYGLAIRNIRVIRSDSVGVTFEVEAS